MSCSRGKADPSPTTKLRLFADSGGYCQNPGCLTELFKADDGELNIHLAEMAHIFSASDSGPRSNPSLTEEERGNYNNLLLLCANCHTMIDKAEDCFPDALISHWKMEHKKKIADVFGFKRLGSRKNVRAVISPLLGENRMIFQTYGPMTEERFNPESELPAQWLRKVRNKILPNNRKILAIIDANYAFLSESEIMIAETYRQHIEDFEAKHINAVEANGIQFPVGMETLFEEQL